MLCFFLSFFPFWYSHYAHIFCFCPIVFGYSACFFLLFTFQLSKFLLSYPQAQRFFPQWYPVYQRAQKAFFISATIFSISCIYFLFFLRIYISLLMLSICSCILSTLSTKVFSILMIVLKKFLVWQFQHSCHIWLILIFVQCLHTVFFTSSIPCNICGGGGGWKLIWVLGKSNHNK